MKLNSPLFDKIRVKPDKDRRLRTELPACEWEGCGNGATPTVEHLHRFGALYEEVGVYMTTDRPAGVEAGEADVHVVPDGAALDRKLTALRALASQTSAVIERLGASVYAAQVSEEAFVDATKVTSAPASSGLVRPPAAAVGVRA